MVEYAAKRSLNRCPTHPGELLRVEVIPATGKTKTEIEPSSEFLADTFTIFLRSENLFLRPQPFVLANSSVTERGPGFGCKAPMIPGTRKASLRTRSRKYRR